MKVVRLVQTVHVFVKHAPQIEERLLLVAGAATCTFQPCPIYINTLNAELNPICYLLALLFIV